MSYDPTQPLPGGWQGQQSQAPTQVYPAMAARRRRRRWPLITGIVVVVVVVLLAVADRVANAVAENTMASQFQSSLALSGKPHVTIQGFPFLTQLAAHDFNTVNISATNETTGPLTIANLTATVNGMHFSSLSAKSATIDKLTASALITFGALEKAGGVPDGITITAAGSNQVKANIDIAGFSESVTVKITQSGANGIHVHFVDVGGLPSDILGSIGSLTDFTVSIPKMPAGVAISNLAITQQGVVVTITGHNTTLSE